MLKTVHEAQGLWAEEKLVTLQEEDSTQGIVDWFIHLLVTYLVWQKATLVHCSLYQCLVSLTRVLLP